MPIYEDKRTWDERFPEEAEHNKRCEKGLPYLLILFDRVGTVWSKRLPYEQYDMETINKIVEEELYWKGHETKWEFAVCFLSDRGIWEYAKGKKLENAIKFLREKEAQININIKDQTEQSVQKCKICGEDIKEGNMKVCNECASEYKF